MANYENLETNKILVTFELTVEDLEKGMQKAYEERKNKISVPGFRKGKVPRTMIESMYGKGFFLKDGLNDIIPDVYYKTIMELGLLVVSSPTYELGEVELGKPIEVKATVYVKPEIVIKKYKGLPYKKFNIEVSDDEVMAVINEERKKNARIIPITERPVEKGDTVTIDFEGFIDDVPFEGGKGEDYKLEIGSKTFIDTFEDQLINHNIDENIDVLVTFPENYGKEELQNKKALFKVTIKTISCTDLPELDDDFALDVSEFDTLDAYKESIIDTIAKEKMKNSTADKESQINDALIENLEVELPEVMVDHQLDAIIKDYENKYKEMGVELEVFLNYAGHTLESFRDENRKFARDQVLTRLALEKIIVLEDINISDDELEEKLKLIAEDVKMDFEKVKSLINARTIKDIESELKFAKAFNIIIDNAISE